LEGVIRTRVGYAGGTTVNPTYQNIGDYSETVQIDFDPVKISYEELLEVFWDSHNPATPPPSSQYKSIIFYHNEDQKNMASESMLRRASGLGKVILTEVIPFSEFYLAEDYHQKYYLLGEPILLDEFKAMYPNTGELIRSTAAARVNGYLGGNGDLKTLKEQLNSFGLTTGGKQKLLEIGTRLPAASN
jgi:peptide-methionine (S)-S-oxide reductase